MKIYDKIIAAGKHHDGKYVHFREFDNNHKYQIKYQVYYKGLMHICECSSEEMAETITNILNNSIESYEYTCNK